MRYILSIVLGFILTVWFNIITDLNETNFFLSCLIGVCIFHTSRNFVNFVFNSIEEVKKK